MRNHLKIIRTLYSPHFITEILLGLELILVVLLLALFTNPLSYFRQQMRLVDSCWKDGNYIYFYMSGMSYQDAWSGGSSDSMDPEEVKRDFPEIEEFYQGAMDNGNVPFEEDDALLDENGNKRGIILAHYNAAMLEKASGLVEIREDIDPKDTYSLLVTPEIAEIFPPGTVLRFVSPWLDQNSGEMKETETPCTVCGIIKKEQVPVTDSAAGIEKAEALTVNTREMSDNRGFFGIVYGEKDIPLTNAMIRLVEGADAEKLAAELNKRYANYGQFWTYAEMKAFSEENQVWVNKNLLLQGTLLSLVFVSHFVGYLAVSTRNKERTNALLSISGMTPARLAAANVCAVLLVLIPAVLIGVLLVPLGEKRYPILTAYGGHGVLWECLAGFSVLVALLVWLTVRSRIRKGNTILLYRRGE